MSLYKSLEIKLWSSLDGSVRTWAEAVAELPDLRKMPISQFSITRTATMIEVCPSTVSIMQIRLLLCLILSH